MGDGFRNLFPAAGVPANKVKSHGEPVRTWLPAERQFRIRVGARLTPTPDRLSPHAGVKEPSRLMVSLMEFVQVSVLVG